MKTEGIYRKNGNMATIQSLRFVFFNIRNKIIKVVRLDFQSMMESTKKSWRKSTLFTSWLVWSSFSSGLFDPFQSVFKVELSRELSSPLLPWSIMKELTEIKLDDPFFSTLLRQKAERTATKKIKRILLKIDEPNRSGKGKLSLSAIYLYFAGRAFSICCLTWQRSASSAPTIRWQQKTWVCWSVQTFPGTCIRNGRTWQIW